METKSKSHLALMEQAVMILVFAFAAALCVQAFQKADAMSKAMADRDRAVNLCQSAAETVKAGSNEDKLPIWYDKDWTQTTETEAVYELCMVCTGTTEFLEQYIITVINTETEEELFCLPVSRQREVPYE